MTQVEQKKIVSQSQTDDHVRMYLMEMGRIPLLSRDEELAIAERIDSTKFGFRTKLLANDLLLQEAYDLLLRVQQKKLRLNRAIEVSLQSRINSEQLI